MHRLTLLLHKLDPSTGYFGQRQIKRNWGTVKCNTGSVIKTWEKHYRESLILWIHGHRKHAKQGKKETLSQATIFILPLSALSVMLFISTVTTAH